MFIKYTKKDKAKFLISKFLIFCGIIAMLILAAHIEKLKLLTREVQLSYSLGIILLVSISAHVILNRINIIFKIKSIGFIVVFVMVVLLESHMSVIKTGLGLMLIPMIIDDTLVNGYFYVLNVNKYWDIYRSVMLVEGR